MGNMLTEFVRQLGSWFMALPFSLAVVKTMEKAIRDKMKMQ